VLSGTIASAYTAECSLREGLVWRLGAASSKYPRTSASRAASSSGDRCTSLRFGLDDIAPSLSFFLPAGAAFFFGQLGSGRWRALRDVL
jgi:hypothetical protein